MNNPLPPFPYLMFTLMIGGDYLGRFSGPPLPADHSGARFNYKYFCIYCGECFATRIEGADGLWVMMPSYCLSCIQAGRRVLDWIFFRLPFEVNARWEPEPILAYEFLYNSEVSFNERRDDACADATLNSYSLGSRAEGDSVR